jgi:D-alanyl-D-alanine carboxypeptidase/D-alanyl-D-alanine-endopeptidase (penicillin-binding protein 4)
MKRFGSAAMLICCCWMVTSAFISVPVFADLNQDINALLRDKTLARAAVGIQVTELGATVQSSRIIYQHKSDLPLIPASNLKLLTTSAALDRLGPDFKFRTQLVYHDGNLILIGGGDPAFGDAELLTHVGWDVTTVYSNWARQLKQRNVGPVKAVLVDDSIFDEQVFHPSWPVDQRLKDYEAEVSGMVLNTNCLNIFLRPGSAGQPVGVQLDPPTRFVKIENQCLTGDGEPWLSHPEGSNEMTLRGKASIANEVPIQITIHDGSMYAGTVLAETLSANGIPCPGDVRRDRTCAEQMHKAIAAGDKSWELLAVHETPLLQAITRANRDSKNIYAECLCKRMGAEASGNSGSWKNGSEATTAFLKKIGVDSSQFKLDDGSGLSKENRVTAGVISAVLCHNYFSPNSKMFTDSLAVAGSEGTLKNRFAGSPLRGRVLAKTGTVHGVSALSGYLYARNGKRYVFSILFNNDTAGTAKGFEEKIVAAIDGVSGK